MAKPDTRGNSNLNHVEWITRASEQLNHISTSATTDRRKAKMVEYDVNHSDESDVDGLAHSVDNDFGVPIMRTHGLMKALTETNEKL